MIFLLRSWNTKKRNSVCISFTYMNESNTTYKVYILFLKISGRNETIRAEKFYALNIVDR